MALPVITVDNFSGWVKIVANQFKEQDLEEYITLFREQYLRQIVGDAAYSDISTQVRQKWDDLLNGVNYVDVDGKRKYHNGFVKSLIRFIYFEFIRDNFTSTQPGKVKGRSENSDRSTELETSNVAVSRYNHGVILINDSTGPFLEANKEFKEGVTSSTDNADNTYTLAIPNTKYLEAGDTLTVNDVEYTAISVTANTNVVIDAGQTGLDFTGDFVIWEPYKDVEFCELEPSGI